MIFLSDLVASIPSIWKVQGFILGWEASYCDEISSYFQILQTNSGIVL